ncbi:MAG: response regulator transcription factor [Planctomycetota bacterium]
MQSKPVVSLVDNDPVGRRSLRWLLSSAGLDSACYESAERFLEEFDPEVRGCVIAELRMRGINGLELVREMSVRRWTTPVVVLTGHADVPTAVRALEIGAAAFIEKPYSPEALLDRIRHLIEQDATIREARSRRADAEVLAASLTPRQREVMQLIVTGHLTKEIAVRLDVSARTVEVHRASVMRKMKADSLAELVALAVRHDLCDAESRPGSGST